MDMKQNQINRLKIVLVEQGRTGKWLSEKLGKDPPYPNGVLIRYNPHWRCLIE